MRILALETSCVPGSACLSLDGDPTFSVDLDRQWRTAQTLLPAIQQLLGEADWTLAELDLVVVSQGPGSFTGLRIGVTVAKTMAYALDVQALGVDTLEALAWPCLSALDEGQIVEAVTDAQRGQLFAASFRRQGDKLERVTESRIADPQPWREQVEPGSLLVGSGLRRLETGELPANAVVADELLWRPSAVAVGQVGFAHYTAGDRSDFWKMLPAYFRLSAAEEKAQQQ